MKPIEGRLRQSLSVTRALRLTRAMTRALPILVWETGRREQYSS